MKILFPFVGDSIGGSHISTFTLLHCLKSEYPSIKIIVLVFSASNSFKKYALSNNIHYWELGIELKNYSKLGIIFDIFKTYKVITKYLLKEDIDIVHTNDLRMHLIFFVASKFVSTKHLWHQRTAMPRSAFGQKFFLYSNKFIVISNFIFNQIRISIPSNKVRIIYNPVESYLASRKELTIRKKLFLKKKHKLAFVANMTNQKRPEFFLKLAKNLTKTHPNKYEFIMIGKVSNEIIKIINKYKKRGELNNEFEVAGFQVNIEKYWSSIDFLISPAADDGFGRTIVEAMRAGVISIAYNSGGHREIIQHEHNGFLIDKLNYKLFISKIFFIEKNFKKYNEILFNAHNDVSSSYSAKAHAQKIVTVYFEMIDD